ncbi:MAG TPA: hypothetical protein VM434_04490, partial [Beijerinckiaceae bacterium]|nr:hypothetical protein [Beijerinckiaceae bacterium]
MVIDHSMTPKGGCRTAFSAERRRALCEADARQREEPENAGRRVNDPGPDPGEDNPSDVTGFT